MQACLYSVHTGYAPGRSTTEEFEMATKAAEVRDFVQNDAVLGTLSAVDKRKVEERIKEFIIPNTTVYRLIVVGIIVALLFSIGIIGWSVVEGVKSESGLTAAIAVATGCFGGLIGTLAPQQS